MVIQRWQSVLLLVAGVVMMAFTFMSLGQVQLTDYSLNFTTLGFSIEGIADKGVPSGYMLRTWILFVVSLMSAILPLINIFMFRNLRAQKRGCLISILFLVAVVCIACYYGFYAYEPAQVSWSSLAFAPLIAFFGEVFAYNLINKDQKLISSSDRIR